MHRFVAMAAAILFSAPVLAGPSPEIIQIKTQMLEPTVQLGMGCSGQLIYSERDKESGDVTTLVLTARHCVQGQDKLDFDIKIPTYDKQSRLISERVYYAEAIAQGYSADVALLRLKDHDTYIPQRVTLAPLKAEFYEGEQVWAVGYPLKWTRTITTGLYAASIKVPVSDIDPHDYIRGTADIAPGSSGGGYYHKNDAGNYELIGTVTGGPACCSFLGLWTPIWAIQDFLKVQAPPGVWKALYPDAK